MSALFPFFDEKPKHEAKAQWIRVLEAAGCRTQREVAAILGVRQDLVSIAKKRGILPPDWLVKLVCLRGVNPYWILHGAGPKFLVPSNHPDGAGPSLEDIPPLYISEEEILQGVLRCFPSSALKKELLRRAR